jgi:glucose-1-phosphate cytidylyltransferase
MKFIDNDNIAWERQPLETLASEGQLSAYHHNGFWQNMDTQHDMVVLNELWGNGKAAWKVWG